MSLNQIHHNIQFIHSDFLPWFLPFFHLDWTCNTNTLFTFVFTHIRVSIVGLQGSVYVPRLTIEVSKAHTEGYDEGDQDATAEDAAALALRSDIKNFTLILLLLLLLFLRLCHAASRILPQPSPSDNSAWPFLVLTAAGVSHCRLLLPWEYYNTNTQGYGCSGFMREFNKQGKGRHKTNGFKRMCSEVYHAGNRYCRLIGGFTNAEQLFTFYEYI